MEERERERIMRFEIQLIRVFIRIISSRAQLHSECVRSPAAGLERADLMILRVATNNQTISEKVSNFGYLKTFQLNVINFNQIILRL